MKVKELIEKLKTFDPELPVLIDGYEYGQEDLEEVYLASATFHVNATPEHNPINGPHEVNYDQSDVSVIYIKRKS